MVVSAASSSRDGTLYGLAMLVSGTFSTVIMKSEYGVRAHGTELCVDPSAPLSANGTATLTTLCPFDKPWFGVLQMKLAMALVLVFLYLRKFVRHADYLATPLMRLRKGGNKYMNTPEIAAMKRKQQPQPGRRYPNASNQESQPLLRPVAPEEKSAVSLKTMVAVALPSLLDLLQTVLANVGLLWISSSVFQMARGSVIIFSAIFSVRLMGKRLFAYHYMSILVVAISVVLVGWAGVGHGDAKSGEPPKSKADSDRDTWNALLGLGFIIAAQVLCALQIVVEEHMMVALNVSPMLLVGLEGLWGLVFYVILIPVLTLTPASSTGFSKIWHEDFYDSFVKVGNSPTLVALILAYIVAVGTLNVTANYVTKHLSAVMRSIAETLRTLGVWMLSLFVYYVLKWQDPNSAGEQWTLYSWVELLGFVLMVYGTLAYKKLIQIPLPSLYAAEKRERVAAYKSPYMSSMHK
uniref:EamA domain-containing protein n=1 Tax=Globisporangium ultimum (strain ATCC 200006 / CBS 805.95 / DAOM BR144) TaxID=431595 RepID=K3WAH1_GLOUD